MRYWSGIIGGVELLDGADVAGFELTGAGAFDSTSRSLDNWTGNTRPGLLGNPHTQYAQIEEGRVLEIAFLHCPKTLLTELMELLIPLIPTGLGVDCSFTDGYQTITRKFKPNVPNWFDRGLPDGDYINDCKIRLIEIGA